MGQSGQFHAELGGAVTVTYIHDVHLTIKILLALIMKKIFSYEWTAYAVQLHRAYLGPPLINATLFTLFSLNDLASCPFYAHQPLLTVGFNLKNIFG